MEGNPGADLLIVGFGGTYGHLHSAMDQLNAMGKKAALAHFRVINPLPKNTAEVLRKYKTIVVAEQNMGQLAGYLRMKSGRYSPASVQSGKRPAVRSKRAGRGFQSTFFNDSSINILEE